MFIIKKRMVAAPFLFSTFVALLTEFNSGNWSVKENHNVYKPVHCNIKWRVYKTCTRTMDFTRHCVEDGLQMFDSKFYNRNIQEVVLFSIPFYNNFDTHAVTPMIKVDEFFKTNKLVQGSPSYNHYQTWEFETSTDPGPQNRNFGYVQFALTSRCDFNLIALDNALHTYLGWMDYHWSMVQVYKDSLRYAEVLNRASKIGLFSPKYVTALGYSLGAEISGHVCRNLHEKCGHILAIDPAGPLYSPRQMPLVKRYPHLQLVSRFDACKVVFVQCNRWILGSAFETAHVNIVVNDGMFQPSCVFGDVLCSHNYCNLLVVDAILKHGHCVATTSETDNREVFVLKLPLDKGIKRCDSRSKKIFHLKVSGEPKCPISPISKNKTNGGYLRYFEFAMLGD